MKINVENIKVLKVEHNGEISIFKAHDIVSLEYKSVSIKGRIAQIADSHVTVDCSTMYNSQIHEVAVKNIQMIVKESSFNTQSEDKVLLSSTPAIKLEENEDDELISLNDDILKDEEDEEEEVELLQPNLKSKEKNKVKTTNETNNDNKEEEELDESVSLFGNIKRNYAQGISPIFNK